LRWTLRVFGILALLVLLAPVNGMLRDLHLQGAVSGVVVVGVTAALIWWLWLATGRL
jgi:hypothetical protein